MILMLEVRVLIVCAQVTLCDASHIICQQSHVYINSA